MTENPVPKPPRQLWLFPPPRPLNDHLGAAFFRGLPRQPGVYYFFDVEGRLLYIGKAKSLRDRLESYRYVHPDRDSRKTWRLVNATRRIEWEVHPSHRDAVLRENRLLRTFRPRFNRANVWPWSAVYIGLRHDQDFLELRIGRDLCEGFKWFGSFKCFALYAFSALQRTLRYVADPARAPLGWFDWDCDRSFQMDSSGVDLDALYDFLAGRCDRFLQEIEAARAAEAIVGLAQQNLVLQDLILLEEFYRKGAQRARQIQNTDEVVTPEALADWLAVQSI